MYIIAYHVQAAFLGYESACNNTWILFAYSFMLNFRDEKP